MWKTWYLRNSWNKIHRNHGIGNKRFAYKMNTEQEMRGGYSTNAHGQEMLFEEI